VRPLNSKITRAKWTLYSSGRKPAFQAERPQLQSQSHQKQRSSGRRMESLEFEVSLGYIARPCIKKPKTTTTKTWNW
jgi:hypothetical protein